VLNADIIIILCICIVYDNCFEIKYASVCSLHMYVGSGISDAPDGCKTELIGMPRVQPVVHHLYCNLGISVLDVLVFCRAENSLLS